MGKWCRRVTVAHSVAPGWQVLIAAIWWPTSLTVKNMVLNYRLFQKFKPIRRDKFTHLIISLTVGRCWGTRKGNNIMIQLKAGQINLFASEGIKEEQAMRSGFVYQQPAIFRVANLTPIQLGQYNGMRLAY